MTGNPRYLVLQIRLTVTAGYFGIFPEPELLVWLRAVAARPGKVLVVQPDQPSDLGGEQARAFRAFEEIVAPDRVRALVAMFESLEFPGRDLEIEGTGDPETTWWAGVTLEVTMDDVSGRLEFGLGPDGVRGRDATSVKEVLRTLFACGGVQSRWSDLLMGRSETAG